MGPLLSSPLLSLSLSPPMLTTSNEVKEQLQDDIINLCCGYSPQITEDLINELCQVIAEWDTELID
jgi:hypothetical protein